jgi:hypothetical protein
MFRVRTNHHHSAPSSDDAALITHFFDRRSNFHAYSLATLQAFYYSNKWESCQLSLRLLREKSESPSGEEMRKVDLFFIFKTVGDPPLREVVGSQLNLDTVAR